jgi:hypothetical protein
MHFLQTCVMFFIFYKLSLRTLWTKDVNLYERIILRWILDGEGWYGLDSSGSGYGRADDSCEYDNETSGSIRCNGILAA